jgi:aminoglycoside N3'-acetyltransferase
LKQFVKSIWNSFLQRRRSKNLRQTLKHLSKDDLLQDLEKVQTEHGATVLVHSSLKSLGFVEGGAQSVIEALVEIFVNRRKGTLLLPTFTIFGTMYKTLISDYVFDVRAKISGLGAIPDRFLHLEAVERSIHPTHSFAALGLHAHELIKDHHLCGTSFGPGSPMAKLIDMNAYIMGLGSDLGHVTFYHCLEEIEEDFPLDVFTKDSPLYARCKDWQGRVVELSLNAHDKNIAHTRIDRVENSDIREFYTKWLEDQAGLRWFQVGRGKVWVVRVDRFYKAIRDLMKVGITIYSTKQDLRRFVQSGK